MTRLMDDLTSPYLQRSLRSRKEIELARVREEEKAALSHLRWVENKNVQEDGEFSRAWHRYYNAKARRKELESEDG